MTRISNGENASAVFDLGLMQIQISANTAAERNMQTGVQPTSLTILPTYKCNASCRECCFQSNPRLSTRLSGKAILDRINEAKAKFPSIRQIIFSGGEALLLKGDLHDAVRLASELGLGTRLVSIRSSPHRLPATFSPSWTMWFKSAKHAPCCIVIRKLQPTRKQPQCE